MPKRRSAARETLPATPQPGTPETPGREPRGARRKRETREKLLRAAFKLIAERGADGVAINEITDAADVGFGSFYNHFKSKDEIHAAVLRIVFEGLGMALDKLTAGLDDAAETLAICTRHSITLAAKEPLWGRLLLREWYRPAAFTLGLGPRLLRDITAGIATQRFQVKDPLAALIMAGGTIVSAIAFQLALEGYGAKPLLAKFGLNAADLDQRTAAVLLQGLGVSAAKAQVIVTKSLPALDWTPSFAQSPQSAG